MSYDRDGFIHITGAFADADLNLFESAIDEIAKETWPDLAIDNALKRLGLIEQERPDRFYEICSEAGGSIAGLRLYANSKINDVLTQIFGPRAHMLSPSLPIVFWNSPTSKRLQYDWHQERSYYPRHPSGAHLWFPLFNDVALDDGPMRIAVGSHKHVFDHDTIKVPGGLTQLKPKADIESIFPIYDCCLKRGDAILFHHNTVHCTGQNRSARPRVCGIIRLIDTTATGRFEPLLRYGYRDFAA